MIQKLYGTLRWAANHPLRQGSKLDAMWSFARAQVGARLVNGDVCVSFPNNTRLIVPPNMKGAVHFIWPGLYDFEEMSFVMHFLKRGDLFIDAGANIGVFTVLASGVAGARTIAFEPAPSTFQFLTRNVLLNNLANLTDTRAVALGAGEAKLRFTLGLGTENHVVSGESSVESVEVESSSLDTQLKGLDPVVIKIDVEGFEQEVLAGAKNCLAKPSLQALIVERVGNATMFGRDEKSVHKDIRDLGFVPYLYAPRSRSLDPAPEDMLGNVIYVRNIELANERLRQAPAYHFANQNI